MNVHYLLPNFFQRLVWLPLRISMVLFCSLDIRGIQNVKRVKGNFIIASNHMSEMDPLLLVSCVPFFSKKLPIIYVSRPKNMYSGSFWKQILYGGTFFKIIGAYPTYKGLMDYERALPHHLRVIQNRNNIGIFPYGGIIRDKNTEVKARGGVSYLALQSGYPVIPLKISGTQNLTLKSFYNGKRRIRFSFGKPIYVNSLLKNPKKVIINSTRNDYQKVAENIMEMVKKLP